MKHNLKQLDQFFDAARQDKPVMDDDAFASIVAKADSMPAGSQTEFMTNSPISRVFSALRQQHGGMIMTGLGLTAVTGLLITGYALTSGDTDKPVTDAMPQQAQVASPVGTALTADKPVQNAAKEAMSFEVKDAIAEVSEATLVTEEGNDPIKPRPFLRAVSIDSLWANVKVVEVKPIEATTEEVDKLGINEGGDGKVFVIHELRDGGVTMRMSFPPTGDDAAYNIKVGNTSNDEGAVAQLMPTMVTDANGKKLAFFFKSQMDGNNMSIQTATFSQRDGFDGESDMPELPNISMNFSIDENIEEDIDVDVDIADELPRRRQFTKFYDRPNFGFNMDSIIRSYGGHGAMMKVFTDDSTFDGKFDFDFKFDTLALNRAMANMKMIFGNGDSSNFKFDFSMDSGFVNLNAKAIRQQARELRKDAEKARADAKQVQEHAFAMRMNVDSLRAVMSKYLNDSNMVNFAKRSVIIGKKFMRDRGMDSIRMGETHKLKQIYNLEALKDLPQLSVQMNDPLTELREFNLPIDRVQIEMINNLVPVQIKKIDPSVKYNKEGLIFWYAKDKTFEEKAPATLISKARQNGDAIADNQNDLPTASVKSASAVSDKMVYPNPTPGRAIFKYTLAEPRGVSFAIHDLLGKQVLKISDLESKTSGTFEKEMDLSSLDAGIYLIIMITDAGEQITQRIVVEK